MNVFNGPLRFYEQNRCDSHPRPQVTYGRLTWFGHVDGNSAVISDLVVRVEQLEQLPMLCMLVPPSEDLPLSVAAKVVLLALVDENVQVCSALLLGEGVH